MSSTPGGDLGGDWRAAEALNDRVHRRSTPRHELETPAQALPRTLVELAGELRQLEREYGQEGLGAPELPEKSGG